MDINPLASDDTYEAVVDAVLNDPGIDMLVLCVVPLSPALITSPGGMDKSIASRLPPLMKKYGKPVVAVMDSGKLFDPLTEALEEAGVVTFRAWPLRKARRSNES